MRKLLFLLVLSCSFVLLKAQSEKTDPTAMFILGITPDARSAGMGDVGVSTLPDVASQNRNASKYIFAESNYGVSLSYVPWLREITKDMNLLYMSGYAKIGDKQVIGASFRYFSIGSMDLTSETDFFGTIHSSEYAIDVSYSRKLGEYLSGGVSLRYVSAIKIEQSSTSAIGSAGGVSSDISFFYSRPINLHNISAGVSISNLGTKIKYSQDSELFLPMELSIGTSFNFMINDKNRLTPTLEFRKSLVPQQYQEKGTGVIEAIGKSFGKSGGDVVLAIGAEYSFAEVLAFRMGYHHNNRLEGFRYLTLGAGLEYKLLNLDLSYLVSTGSISNAISNTLRLTIAVKFN